MKHNLPPKVVGPRGITLVELTVVIVMMLALVAILFVGSRAWKRGCDRSSCILNLRSMQIATRSYQNLHGYDYGGRPVSEYGTRDIASHLLAKNYIAQGLYEQVKGSRSCAGGGIYHCDAPEFFPKPGKLYMNCSLSVTEDHVPAREIVAGW